MNDKRFRVRFEQEDGKGEIVNEKGVELTAREVVDLLNEQQATITKLKELNDDKGKRIISLIRTNKTLKEENEQLQAQIREKEQDEQLYANEIVKLNKEAKEVLDFKSLGGDY